MRSILIMSNYFTSLNIGNGDQLMKTVAEYLSDTPPQRSQIIYLYGMGCNGKSAFLDTLIVAIEKVMGYSIPYFPLPDLTEIAVFKSKLFVPYHPPKIGVICYHKDHLSSNLKNLIGVVDQWSTLSHIHRGYFVMSNQPITDPDLRKQVIYCNI
jgi:hypothetical protein